jgi:hypothetical protein
MQKKTLKTVIEPIALNVKLKRDSTCEYFMLRRQMNILNELSEALITELVNNYNGKELVQAINDIKIKLNSISPMKDHPIDLVLWVPIEEVHKNDYNPNSVAPTELKLLETSICEAWYTQPVVTWINENNREIVDGFHRSKVAKESQRIGQTLLGFLPVTTVRNEFYQPGMEFEEFVPLFGEWYVGDELSAAFVGIRADESLNRYKTIAVFKKNETLNGHSWSTLVSDKCYNIYPIYDWKASDIWKYHSLYPDKPYNKVYDKMQMAGVPLKHQRLYQPYGDTQRRGLWLYSVLEPNTWSKLIARVIGANSYALYAQETGNINGEGTITKPANLTWEQYSKILLKSLPRKTAEHYAERIRRFIGGWSKRGYMIMPDEADHNIENLHFALSWRRVCKTLLRNDYWCKGLGFSQPKSDTYGKYLELKGKIRTKKKATKWGAKP